MMGKQEADQKGIIPQVKTSVTTGTLLVAQLDFDILLNGSSDVQIFCNIKVSFSIIHVSNRGWCFWFKLWRVFDSFMQS